MLIINGKLITWGTDNQVMPEGWGLLIRNGVIEKIAPQDELLRRLPG
jgi:hypothetical protein